MGTVQGRNGKKVEYAQEKVYVHDRLEYNNKAGMNVPYGEKSES